MSPFSSLTGSATVGERSWLGHLETEGCGQLGPPPFPYLKNKKMTFTFNRPAVKFEQEDNMKKLLAVLSTMSFR